VFERPDAGEKAVLVQLMLPGVDTVHALSEFNELAESAGATVVATLTGTRATPEAKYYIGLGKAQELSELVNQFDAELVLVNHELSPSQERNLEKLLSCRVVGRSGLILDIFAKRARTFEGKLQVELAQLKHLSTRLIRGWTHLERQKGGIGLRGPGETQLETDRRLLKARIRYINQRLDKVRKNRQENRRARVRAEIPTVSLVGYTNAGKSTLFKALTGASVYVADQLFATLDPLMRKVSLEGASSIILTDTVGFVRDLPHQLVEAFRATLEETQEAQLLLHVIDISDPNWRDNVHAVELVLHELNVDDIPLIQVFNKIDCVEGLVEKIQSDEKRKKVWISAVTGDGLSLLKDLSKETLFGQTIKKNMILAPYQGKLRATLYEMGAVLSERRLEDGGCELLVCLSPRQYAQYFNDDLGTNKKTE
jgi:GTP-binding protein HflX